MYSIQRWNTCVAQINLQYVRWILFFVQQINAKTSYLWLDLDMEPTTVYKAQSRVQDISVYRISFHGWFVELVVPVQEMFVLSWLL
jgi:hypothetical protein